MQEEQAETPDETTAEEATAEQQPETGDQEVAAAVDAQADESSGAAAEQEPEVPDDARETIARAQDHIDNLDMTQERKAADQTTKRL